MGVRSRKNHRDGASQNQGDQGCSLTHKVSTSIRQVVSQSDVTPQVTRSLLEDFTVVAGRL
jgi:hypothetical protein